MWDKIKDVSLAIYETVWEERDWKEAVSIFVGIAVGLYLGSALVYYQLAKEGCKVSIKLGHTLLNGFMGLGLMIFVLLVVWNIVYRLLDVPKHIATYKRRKEYERENGITLPKKVKHTVTNPDMWKGVGLFSLFIITLILISFCAGYIWWMIFC